MKIEDKLCFQNLNNLDIINTFFSHINISNSNKNESKNNLIDFSLSLFLSHLLDNNLEVLLSQM